MLSMLYSYLTFSYTHVIPHIYIYIYIHTYRLFPYNYKRFTILSKMQFRIYHIIFCEQHKLLRNSLAFDEYVQHVYEKFLMEIVEIRLIDWAFLCVLILLNWARTSVKVHMSMYMCICIYEYICLSMCVYISLLMCICHIFACVLVI